MPFWGTEEEVEGKTRKVLSLSKGGAAFGVPGHLALVRHKRSNDAGTVLSLSDGWCWVHNLDAKYNSCSVGSARFICLHVYGAAWGWAIPPRALLSFLALPLTINHNSRRGQGLMPFSTQSVHFRSELWPVSLLISRGERKQWLHLLMMQHLPSALLKQ